MIEHAANDSTKKTKRPTWLPVVAGIIRREKSVLLGRRPEGGSLAGLWEFPGGKIELGEFPEGALARELKEELGIDSEIGSLLFATSHNYGDVGVLLLFYEVKYWKGQPQTQHHSELKWFNAEELKTAALPDANRNVLERILLLLK
jgi:8-oxo-dGTP diphosphatase